MHTHPFAEWFLSRGIGAERAAALYGDLEELSATRGRLWFWTAYFHALLPLGWRVAVAVFALAIPFRYSYGIGSAVVSSMHWVFRWLPGYSPWFHFSFWMIPLGNTLVGLAFLLPFVLVRFGIRDRLVQLAGAIFLIGLPIFSFRPAAIEFVGTVTGVTVLASLCLRDWRRPMIILTLTLAAQYAFLKTVFYPSWVSRQDQLTPLHLLDLMVAAIVCTYLHHRLLQSKPRSSGPVIA